MARHFLRLKFVILRNGLRGSTLHVVGFVIGVVVGLGAALSGLVGFLVTGTIDPEGSYTLHVFAGALIVLGWVLLPTLLFGVDETLDPTRFALLPLRTRTLATGLLAAAAIGIPSLATATSFLGLPLGMIGRGPAATIAALGSAVVAFLLCLVASRAVTSVLAPLLRSRRARDFAVVAIALLSLISLPIQFLAGVSDRMPTKETLARVADAVAWTPFGAAFAVPHDIANGRLGIALGHASMALGTVVLLFWLWMVALGRLLEDVSGSSDKADTIERNHLFPRLLRWLPQNELGALVAGAVRTTWRDPRRRVGLIVTAVIALGLPLTMAPGAGGLPESAVFATVIVGAMGAFTLANSFGYDGSGWALHLLVPVPGRLELRARTIALGLLLAPLALVAAVVLAALGGGWSLLPEALGVTAAAYGVSAPGMLAVSVLAPYSFPESNNPFTMTSGGSVRVMITQMVSMLAVGGVLLPVGGLLLALLLLAPAWSWVMLPVGVAYGYGASRLGSRIFGDLLDHRGPETLAAITPGRY